MAYLSNRNATIGLLSAAALLAGMTLPARAVTLAVDYTATSAGTPITIGGSSNPQYTFYFGDYLSSIFPNSYSIAGNNGSTIAFPDNGFPQSQLAQVATHLSDVSYTDGNYQLAFDIGKIAYTGLASVTDQGTVINSITYNPVSVSAVLESATWAMMLVGFGGLGLAMRLHRRKVIVAA
jgi:hypothetical protein